MAITRQGSGTRYFHGVQWSSPSQLLCPHARVDLPALVIVVVDAEHASPLLTDAVRVLAPVLLLIPSCHAVKE